MTIQNLIAKVQEEKPNTFSDEKLISYINEIESEVAEQLCVDFDEEYTIDDVETELMAPKPYDRLYTSYVKAMVDYANEEYASYQNNQVQHVQDFRDFTDYVVREGLDVESTFPRRLRNIM